MNVTETYSMFQVYESSDHGIFRVDDVFVTGMLAEKANVSHRDISDLITFYEDWDEEVSRFVCLFVHIGDLITFYKDWYKEVSRETKCRCP